MNISKMEAVLAVAKTKSFSEAAYEVSLSQSAVSKHVASVEEELGVSLIKRTKTDKSVKLTPEGEIFVRHAQKMLQSYEDMRREISNLSKEAKIPFVVNNLPVPTYGTFNPSVLVSTFFVEHPHLDLQVTRYAQSTLLDTLLEECIDAAIVRILVERGIVLPPESWLYDNRMEIDEICENTCLIALPEDHPLADHKVLYLEDLRDERILLQRPVGQNGEKPTYNVRFNMFRRSCINAGFEPEFVSAMDPTHYQGEINFSLVKRGQGVMVIHIPVRGQIDGIRLLPLVGLDWFAKTIVVSKKGHRRKDVDKLVNVLHKLLAENQVD